MKNIRSKVVKQSLLDYNALAKSLQENTEGAVKNLLSETVRDTYAKLLSEAEYDEDEVNVDDAEDGNEDMNGEVKDTKIDASGANDAEDGAGAEDIPDGNDAGMEAGAEGEGGDIPSGEGDEEVLEDDADADGDDWAEFDKYKVSDDEYDFSNAEDEEIVKVYKLMKNDDQILVHKDEDKVKIQDNETGAEYIIELGDDGEADAVGAVEPGEDESEIEMEMDDDGADADFDDADDMNDDFSDDDEDDFDEADEELMNGDFGGEDDEEDFEDEGDFEDEDEDDTDIEDDDDENNDIDNMKESTERMFELVLEYDSNVGYTDNYQKKKKEYKWQRVKNNNWNKKKLKL